MYNIVIWLTCVMYVYIYIRWTDSSLLPLGLLPKSGALPPIVYIRIAWV